LGRPSDPLVGAGFAVVQLLDGREGTRDHVAGRLPDFIGDVGFAEIQTGARLRTAFGTLELISAVTK
jgi:hypothetical protein